MRHRYPTCLTIPNARCASASPAALPASPRRLVRQSSTSGNRRSRHRRRLGWWRHGLSSVAMAHVGFMTKLPWMLASGRTTHLLERWRARPILDLITRTRCRPSPASPQIALLLNLPDITEHDFDHVKAIASVELRLPRRSLRRPVGSSAPRTRFATARPRAAASGSAPPSTPTTTRRCTRSADLARGSRPTSAMRTALRCPMARSANSGSPHRQ